MSRPTSALIIDDEAHVRTYLRLMLGELNVATQWEASDGARGLELALEHRPELVLLDINLIGMDGLEVLGRLTQEAPEIPVIMVTARTAIETIREAHERGAAGYVIKHLPRVEVLASLREAIEGLDESAA
jgi:two-component system, chemotaxis family, chemotaxis protein CheY